MAILAEILGNGRTFLQLWCVGITAVILIWGLRGRTRSRFRGATVWPLLGVLPSLLFNRRHLYNWVTHLVVVNGGTFRLPGPWKCRVFTADPANIEYLLKTRYANFGKGEIFKDSFRLMFGDSILAQDGESFKRLSVPIAKAFSSPAFRDGMVVGLPAVMQQNLLPIFTHACEKAAIIDLQDVFHRLACHNAWLFGAGVELDCLKPSLPKFPFIEAFGEATQSIMFRLLMHPFCWKILFERRFLKAKDFVYGFSIQQWCSRGCSPVSDIASAFLEYEGERGRLYSDKRKYELLVNLIFAGKDSITAGLTWFFWLVAKHPLVEAHILAELRQIVKQRQSPDDQNPFSFSFEEIKEMDYLHSAVTESLRLYPPVPIESTVSAEDDVLPDGTPVEKGAQVFYSIYSSGRLESVWGEDCVEFKPERWMKNGRFVRQSDSKFVVFNGGPRRCTGMEFAYWQMKWAAASVLIRYSIKMVDKHPVIPKYGLSLFMKYGLLATVHQREIVDGESSK
ncbi:hypothetical protein SUGI_1169650 [Cryptomeria japonica]|nr:hypothetical protein SUGI_1169650 [Cryptomeria japonica]